VVQDLNRPRPVPVASALLAGRHTAPGDGVLESADAHGRVFRGVTERQVRAYRPRSWADDLLQALSDGFGQRIDINSAAVLAVLLEPVESELVQRVDEHHRRVLGVENRDGGPRRVAVHDPPTRGGDLDQKLCRDR
jgi:hypothetical protein